MPPSPPLVALLASLFLLLLLQELLQREADLVPLLLLLALLRLLVSLSLSDTADVPLILLDKIVGSNFVGAGRINFLLLFLALSCFVFFSGVTVGVGVAARLVVARGDFLLLL